LLKGVLLRGGRLDVIEGVEIVVEAAIAVGVGLWAAHSGGLGAPLLEGWLRRERVFPRLSSPLAPALTVGLFVGTISSLPGLPIFHPNRKTAHHGEDTLRG
jgi:hypothetical protein